MPKHYTEAIDEPQKAKPKPKAPKKASMPDEIFPRKTKTIDGEKKEKKEAYIPTGEDELMEEMTRFMSKLNEQN